MRKQYARRIIAALMAVALGLAAVGMGQSQQAGSPQSTPQIMADPGSNGGGTGG